MIQAIVKLVLSPTNQEEALNILRFVAIRTRAEAGCLGCYLYRDTENEAMIVYEEDWKNETALQNHLVREDYQKVLLVIEMASAPPQIKFNTIKTTAGVEVIEKARSVYKQGKDPEV